MPSNVSVRADISWAVLRAVVVKKQFAAAEVADSPGAVAEVADTLEAVVAVADALEAVAADYR